MDGGLWREGKRWRVEIGSWLGGCGVQSLGGEISGKRTELVASVVAWT